MDYIYPGWETASNLGTYYQNYSFDLNPLIINYYAGSNSTVTLINGQLPTGLRWLNQTNSLAIYGAVVEQNTAIYGQFTFRILQPNGAIADRTFNLSLAPVPVSPNWSGQNTFLGYQSNSTVKSYQLAATTSTGNHILYDLPDNPLDASIGYRTGILSYTSNNILIDTTVSLTVRATDEITTVHSNAIVSIGIVAVSTGPQWLTPAGTLSGLYYGSQFIEYDLVAEDPYGGIVYYQLVSSSPGFTLNLASPQPPVQSGVLYGTLPAVLQTTIFSFTVRASSTNGSYDRTFEIVVEPSSSTTLFTWSTSTDLGTYDEAQYLQIPVQAVSQRSTNIHYSVSGGLLPPHLMLGSGGIIEGFCEFTALDKTYYFDITANDGIQLITNQFSMTIKKIYYDQFFSAYLPLTGSLKDSWQADAGNIFIREPGTAQYDSLVQIPSTPVLPIIQGLFTNYDTPEQILESIQPWWHELYLQIGTSANTAVNTNNLSVIYRNIVDNQQQSVPIVQDLVVAAGTVTPVSINNVRYAFKNRYSFVSAGDGTAFAFLVNLNYNNGSISSVTILDSGYNFRFAPIITVSGAGTGGNLAAILGLVTARVVTSSAGWQVGTLLYLSGNDAVRKAVLTISSVDNNGSIQTVSIVDPGNYNVVGTSSTETFTSSSGSIAEITLSWGIVTIDVISGGSGYDCGINVTMDGHELLPSWQTTYIPAIEVGQINPSVAPLAANILDTEPTTMLGTLWQPTIMIMQWQGLRYIGTTSFDGENTTFDGNTTRLIDTEGPFETVFDSNNQFFDNRTTIFDWKDPIYYDLYQVWGSTLIDAGTTAFDLYSTIFDQMDVSTYSRTRLQKWITTNNIVYSGNNALW